MFISIKRTATALSLLCLAGAASAQGYIGGDLGSTRVDGFSSAGAYGIFGGYQLGQNLAVEGAYRVLGRFESGSGSVIRLNQAQVSALGMLPLGDRVKLYGRLGYGFLNKSGTKSYNADNGVILGAGAQFDVTSAIAVRGEYTKVASDAKQFNLGVVYKF